jgi:uncharacterized integral membrane protein
VIKSRLIGLAGNVALMGRIRAYRGFWWENLRKKDRLGDPSTIYHMIYLLTAIGLTPGGSSTVHIYMQIIHRTTQLTRTTQ